MRKRIARIGAALLVTLALGGTAAAAAQAHEWTIKGETLVKHGLVSEKLGFSKASNFTFDFEAGEVNWEWTCAPSLKEGSIAQGGKGSVQFNFSACAWDFNFGKCKIAPIAGSALRTELIEVGGVLYLKFVPAEGKGETLFKFHIGGGSECVVNTEWEVQGNFAGKIAAAKTSQPEHALEFSPAINTAAGANFHVGPSKAKLTGGFTNTLAGGFAGTNWAAE